MKKALLFAFSLITIIGGASLLAEPANAASVANCTPPKGLPADCYLKKCECGTFWCTGTWQCDGYEIVK